MKVALAHDYLNQYGGAERVLEQLHDLYPDAPIYTSMYAPDVMPAAYRSWDIRTSFMQRLPLVTTRHQAYLMAYPIAFESFDLSAYDMVISNSSAFCKGVVTGPSTLHISYCLTPMRWVWNYRAYVERERLGGVARMMLPPLIHYLRVWDAMASSRVDRYVAISQRCRGAYPEVLSPRFGDHLSAGRHGPVSDARPERGLLHDGRSDDAVPAQGPHRRCIPRSRANGQDRRRRPGPSPLAGARNAQRRVHRAGWTTAPSATCTHTAGATCSPAKRISASPRSRRRPAGKPVIAYAAGGALDTVIDGETGVHFARQTPRDLAEAVRRFESLSFDADRIRQNARRFSSQVFRERFSSFVERAYQEWRADLGQNQGPHG